MKKLILIDGNSLLFKAYFATKYANMMMTSNGIATNAVVGFINILNKINNDFDYDYLLVAFDASSNTLRHQKYKDYKGTRDKTDDDLVVQFPLIREYLDYKGIPNYEIEGYEADDIIGTLSKLKDLDIKIISSDKDLLQLVDDNVSVLLSKKGMSDYLDIKVNTMDLVWDIKPMQVIDLKALMGDPSDNIPGVKGIGEKTALKLIDEYQSLDGIYENIDKIKGKVQEKLVNDKDMAYQSYDLAKIITDIDLPFTIEDLKIKDEDTSKLKDFYHKYELKSLLSKMNSKDDDEKEDIIINYVSNVDKNILLDNSFIDFISLNEYYHKDTILGLLIINEKGNYFIEIGVLINSEDLLLFLEHKKKKCYDMKKNILIAYWHGIKLDNIIDDVMISSYLINSNISLEPQALVDTNFNIATKTNKDLLKLDRKIQIEQKVEQAYYLNKLIDLNKNSMEVIDVLDLYSLEIEVAKILSDMEINGILIDKDILRDITKDFQIELDKIEKEIYGYANKEFNINSVKQLGEVLFEDLNLRVIKKNKTGYSTDTEVLQALENDHPIISVIIKYRIYSKLLSTYLIPMPKYILEDNRIHTIYNQTLTQTGRLSSKEPNLQNISTRDDIRRYIKKFFISKEGYSLVSFDYSQIELRILASFSNDKVFKEAFINGLDIHSDTASKVYNLAIEDVSKEQRKHAKAINFGIVYGISDFGLAKQLGIDRNDARDFINKYYMTYPNIKGYLEQEIANVDNKGYSRTILNRIRYIDEIRSNNYHIKEQAKRIAMNTPIQGSAADIIKLAMRDCFNYINENNIDAKMLLQVHDELIFEVNDKIIDDFIKEITNIMINVYKLDVKLEVNSSYAKDWYHI